MRKLYSLLFAYNTYLSISQMYLSYDVTVIQWITSCHENRLTTHVITLWHVDHAFSFLNEFHFERDKIMF